MPFSSLSIRLRCPNCGQETAALLASIEAGGERFDCAECGRTVVIAPQQINDELARLAEAVDELADRIRAFRARMGIS